MKRGITKCPSTGRLVALPPDERLLMSCVPEPNTGCWLWEGSAARNGYGWFTGFGERKAHRASYVMHKGRVPKGLLVLHHCDTPACINPAHLYAGTPKDNSADASRRGRLIGINAGDKNGMRRHPERAARGDRNGSRKHPERLKRGSQRAGTKLDERQVSVMRSRHRAGETCRSIAADYGVSESLVAQIMRGRIWRHVP